jgi:hypothetical protein
MDLTLIVLDLPDSSLQMYWYVVGALQPSKTTGGKMEAAEERYKVVVTKGTQRKNLGEKSETELYSYLNTRPLGYSAAGDVLARLVLQHSMTVSFKGSGKMERIEITRADQF